MKNNLIRQLKSTREQLLNITSKLPDEGILINKWGKKEILSHIAGWEEEGVTCIPQILHGEKPKSFRMSINRFNEESVTKRKKMTVEQILYELKEQNEDFLKQIEQLTNEQIIGFYGTKLGEKEINVLWVIHEQISHDNNHAKELEEKFK